RRQKIGNVFGDNKVIWNSIFSFLILFPVFIIPIFWVTYLVANHIVVSTNLLFIILFGTLLALALILSILVFCCANIDNKIFDTIIIILYATCFYPPNILQTL